MKVFKFGGASIQHADRIRATADIILKHSNKGLLVVISALGKTTNGLEAVVNAFFDGNNAKAIELFDEIKAQHINLVNELLDGDSANALAHLEQFFTEAAWMLHDDAVQSYDYYYDQIVCIGEMMSTTIMYHYILKMTADVHWLDARDIIRTDNNFRDAVIDFDTTKSLAETSISPLLNEGKLVITQGFIGSTDENESTTLGREGSDYSAAILANVLNLESVTIWKDVDAVMNADPRKFPNAVKISSLSYQEVIEMAYYGAQVIHPKTIKPIQNKRIPLYVKSFIDPELPGTIINDETVKNLPPIIVVKNNQVFMQFKTVDYSFVGGSTLEKLHTIFAEAKINPSLSQNTAISLLCVFDDKTEKIDKIASEAAAEFDVAIEKNLTLLTIRHYTDEIIAEQSAGKMAVLIQKTPETIQLLMRN